MNQKRKKRFPLRHVPLFWLGLLPVVVLLWAWGDGRRYQTAWEYGRDPLHAKICTIYRSGLELRLLSIRSATGEAVGTIPPFYELFSTGPGGEWERVAKRSPGRWFAMPMRDSASYIIPDAPLIREVSVTLIPFWLLLLLYVPLWLRLSFWHARRMTTRQRLAEWRMIKAAKADEDEALRRNSAD